MDAIHIQNTNKEIRMPTLCRLKGKAVYKPLDSNCEDCISRFKLLYPGSYEAWVRKREGDK